jgi:hypothetical protein
LSKLSLLFFFIFQSLQAQVLTTDTSRPLPIQQRQFQFKELGPAHALMSGVHTIHGFEIQFKIDYANLGCQHAADYVVELALLYDEKMYDGERSKVYLERCGNFLRLDFQQMLTFDGKTSTYLATTGMPKEQIENIVSLVQKQKEQLHATREALISLRQLIRTEGKNFSDEERYKILQSSRDTISKFSGPYFRHLGEIVLTQKAGNKGASRNLLRKFINMNPFRIAFEFSPWLYNEEWTKEDQEKLFLEVSLYIAKVFKREMPLEVDIFMTLISQMHETRLISSMSSNYQTDWSLVRIREAIALDVIAYSYPSFWYSQLSHRTSTTLVNGYLNEFLDSRLSKQTLAESLWIFLDQTPAGDRRSKSIVDQAHSLSKEDWYHQFVLLEFLARPGFRDDLSKIDSQLGRPVFLMKREYFRNLYHSGLAPSFSLMQLALLGDLDRNYLWMMAAQ